MTLITIEELQLNCETASHSLHHERPQTLSLSVSHSSSNLTLSKDFFFFSCCGPSRILQPSSSWSPWQSPTFHCNHHSCHFYCLLPQALLTVKKSPKIPPRSATLEFCTLYGLTSWGRTSAQISDKLKGGFNASE